MIEKNENGWKRPSAMQSKEEDEDDGGGGRDYRSKW